MSAPRAVVADASVEHRPDPSRPVAGLVGEVDLSNVDALGRALREGVPNTAVGLVLDLTRVTYLDSTGVRLIFELARELADRQQDVRVVVPHASPLRRVLRLAGVDAALPLLCEHGVRHDDEECGR